MPALDQSGGIVYTPRLSRKDIWYLAKPITWGVESGCARLECEKGGKVVKALESRDARPDGREIANRLKAFPPKFPPPTRTNQGIERN